MTARCKWITRTPIFGKSLSGPGGVVINIDPCEFENERGAHLMDKEVRCEYLANSSGYCPRHEAEHALLSSAQDKCEDCGHVHQHSLAGICIGCPCPRVFRAADVPVVVSAELP